MKNTEIHDLINLKAKRLEVEVSLGISNIENSHLSRAQVDHITHNFEDSKTQFSILNQLNNVIRTDELIIYNRH